MAHIRGFLELGGWYARERFWNHSLCPRFAGYAARQNVSVSVTESG